MAKRNWSKSDEIEAIQKLANDLGTASYLGPWLESIADELKHVIQNDMPVVHTIQEVHQQQRSIEARGQALEKDRASLRRAQEDLQFKIHAQSVREEHFLDGLAVLARNAGLQASVPKKAS